MKSSEKRNPSKFRRAEDADSASSDSVHLADAAMTLLGCQNEDEVYEAIGAFLLALAPDAVVIVNETSPDLKWLTTRRVFGLDDSALSGLAEIVGFDPIGKRFALSAEHSDEMLGGKLSTISGGFAELAALEMPRTVAQAGAKAFQLCDAFSIGIADQHDVLGNVQIYTRTPGAVLPVSIIESFAHHCFSALESICKDRDLAEKAESNRLVLHNMVEGLALHEIVLDEAGKPCDYRFLEVNPAFEAQTGLKAEDIIGRTVLEVLPGTELEWIKRYGLVATTGAPARFEDFASELGRYFEVMAYSPAQGQFVSVSSDITERTLAEAALRESEEHLRRLFDRDPDGIVILDPATARPLEFNTTAHEQLGYTREEFAKLTIADIEDMETFEETKSRIGQVLRDGRVDFETRHRTKTGEIRHIAVTAQTLYITGEPVYHCIWRDVTERTTSAAKLEESEGRFRAALSASPVAMALSDGDQNVIFVNPQFVHMFGYTQDDIPTLAQLWPKAYPDPLYRESIIKAWNSEVERVDQTGEPFTPQECLVRCKNGEIRSVRIQGASFGEKFDEQLVVFHDVSGQRAAESNAREQSDRLELVLDSTVEGIHGLDLDGNITFCNAASVSMLGLDSEEGLLGRNGHEAYHHTRRDGTPYDVQDCPIFQSLWSGGAAHVEDEVFWRADGTSFPVEYWVRPMLKDGRPVGTVISFIDVTDRNRLEDALQRRLLALTQPPSAIGGLTFSDLFDVEQIQSIQDAFSAATGVAAIIVKPDGTPITRPSNYSRLCADIIQRTGKGCANCAASDAAIGCENSDGPVVRRCLSAGLLDAGASIHAGNEHVANWLIAQVRDEAQDEDELLAYADEIGADRAEYTAALSELPVMSREKFELIAQAMSAFADELSTIAFQNVQQARFITERMQAERELVEEQGRGLEGLKRSLSSIVQVVSQVAETRDPYTAGHQRRVTELAMRISQEMGMPAEQTEDIRIAALLHDIGKMSIPAEILSKPGRLSDIEFALIKTHSEIGYAILASADMQGPIAEIVYQHHERCDGSGYPRGLSADEMLVESKVLMVADVVEAMMSHRPYRPGLGQSAALIEIERGAGTVYDTDVVESCLRAFHEDGFEFSEE